MLLIPGRYYWLDWDSEVLAEQWKCIVETGEQEDMVDALLLGMLAAVEVLIGIEKVLHTFGDNTEGTAQPDRRGTEHHRDTGEYRHLDTVG